MRLMNRIRAVGGRRLRNGGISSGSPPAVVSITIATSGAFASVLFNKVVTGGSGGLSFATPTSTATYATGNGTTTLVFSLSDVIYQGQTPTASYVPGTIMDLGGRPLAAFSGAAVINNSTQVAAIALINTAVAGSSNLNDVTTSAIDTTGANFLVASLAWNAGVTANAAITDSKGNTWVGLTARHDNVITNAKNRLFYCASPTVGTGHTFTNTALTGFPSIGVAAFSGVHATPFDQESGAISAVATLQPGSITPSDDGCLLVAGLCNASANAVTVDSGYSDVQVLTDGATHVTGALAWKIQTVAGAENPLFDWTAGNGAAGTGASFLGAA